MISIEKGISIIMNRWLEVEPDELILLVTDENHLRELKAFERWARGQDAALRTAVLDSAGVQRGDAVEEIAPLLMRANVIIGATDNSFITHRRVTQAVESGARFISLPLSCSDGTSLLENDFIGMSPARTKRMANMLIPELSRCDEIRVTTRFGTDLRFFKRGRRPGSFFGKAERRGVISSASFEVYVPIEETKTEGRLILDGSMGYLGTVSEPVEIIFREGKLSAAQETPDSKRLIEYMDSFKDPGMYLAAEFGIGLNTISRCRGVSYIEDESAYGTFHIGMGRNIALGGKHEAAGHFDIVTHRPDIFAGDRLIMREGRIACGR